MCIRERTFALTGEQLAIKELRRGTNVILQCDGILPLPVDLIPLNGVNMQIITKNLEGDDFPLVWFTIRTTDEIALYERRPGTLDIENRRATKGEINRLALQKKQLSPTKAVCIYDWNAANNQPSVIYLGKLTTAQQITLEAARYFKNLVAMCTLLKGNPLNLYGVEADTLALSEPGTSQRLEAFRQFNDTYENVLRMFLTDEEELRKAIQALQSRN